MITEIISGLWIGSLNDSYDKELYTKYNISVLLNCSTTKPFPDIPTVKKVRLPIQTITDIKRHRDKILDHLQQLYLKESMLLVCEEDFALVIASLFLVYVGRVSMVDIKHILHQKNPKLVLDRKLDEF